MTLFYTKHVFIFLAMHFMFDKFVEGETFVKRQDPATPPPAYEVVAQQANYSTAAQLCAERGATLPMPKTQAENDALDAFTSGSGSFYLGLSDAVTEGAWLWADGSSLTWNNWVRDGETGSTAAPNGGPGRNEAVMMKDFAPDGLGHRWTDIGGFNTFRQVVCQTAATDIERLEARMDAQEADSAAKDEQISAQAATIESLLTQMADQMMTINDIRNDVEKKTSTHIEFFATLSTPRRYNTGETVVYNQAPINAGGGYNTSTGVFTAPVAGTYKMQVYGMTQNGSYISITLKCMSDPVFVIFTRGWDPYDHNSAGNAGYVRLLQGQTCRVVARSTMKLFSVTAGGATVNSFSGHLVHQD